MKVRFSFYKPTWGVIMFHHKDGRVINCHIKALLCVTGISLQNQVAMV